jgi:glycyl-tRNA synthetase
MPLTGNAEFQPYVEKVTRSLRRQGLYTVVEAQKLRIGKRYYRHDEIGTPFCITVDHQTLKDQTVTIRDRDSTEQYRTPISNVTTIINDKIWGDEAPDLD